MILGTTEADAATLDHLWPKAKVGKLGDFGVCLLAHRVCNQARGAALPTAADRRRLVRVYRRFPQNVLKSRLEGLERLLQPYRSLLAQEQFVRALIGQDLKPVRPRSRLSQRSAASNERAAPSPERP
jgi:hypothetical protein